MTSLEAKVLYIYIYIYMYVFDKKLRIYFWQVDIFYDLRIYLDNIVIKINIKG